MRTDFTFTASRFLIAAFCVTLLIFLGATVARAQGPTGGTMYSVQYGDTLSSVASRYGVSPEMLMRTNGMSSPYGMYVGRQMNILFPASYGYEQPYVPSTFFVYRVEPGDTLFNIARRFGVSVFTLARINRLFNPNFIFSGMRLLIPRAYPVPAPRVYIVQFGDTLTRIAVRFHTSVIALLVANNLSNPNLIFAGMRLIIPGSAVYPSQPPPYAPPGMTPTPMPTVGPGGTSSVSLRNIAYHPNSISVRAGTTVVWTNNESSAIPHTVTSGAPNAPSGAFDSGTLNSGQRFQFTFSTPGTFAYFCRIHGAAMTGTVTVTP